MYTVDQGDMWCVCSDEINFMLLLGVAAGCMVVISIVVATGVWISMKKDE
jgi:hypothetical protein